MRTLSSTRLFVLLFSLVVICGVLAGETRKQSTYADNPKIEIVKVDGILVQETNPEFALTSLTDSAVLRGTFSVGVLAKKDVNKSFISYLLIKNSFIIGLSGESVNDTGITVNMNVGNALRMNHFINSPHAIKFGTTAVDDSLFYIYQTFDSVDAGRSCKKGLQSTSRLLYSVGGRCPHLPH